MNILLFGSYFRNRSDLKIWLEQQHEVKTELEQNKIYLYLKDSPNAYDVIIYELEACGNADATIMFIQKLHQDFSNLQTIVVSNQSSGIDQFERILDETGSFDCTTYLDLEPRMGYFSLKMQLIRLQKVLASNQRIKNKLEETILNLKAQLTNHQNEYIGFENSSVDFLDIIEKERESYKKEKEIFKKFLLNGLTIDDSSYQEVLENLETPFMGDSVVTNTYFETALNASKTKETVFIEGKNSEEIQKLALTIHFFRTVAYETPFFEIDCAKSADIETELFGAYDTKTLKIITKNGLNKIGKLTQAEGGILFINNIDMLPVKIQTMLTLALETGIFTPKGGYLKEHNFELGDVDLLIGTTKDIHKQIKKCEFSWKLYKQLDKGTIIRVPQLYDRPTDIQLIIRHLIVKFTPNLVFENQAIACLAEKQWRDGLSGLEYFIKTYLPNQLGQSRLFISEIDINLHFDKFAKIKTDFKAGEEPTEFDLYLNPKSKKAVEAEFEILEATASQFFPPSVKLIKILDLEKLTQATSNKTETRGRKTIHKSILASQYGIEKGQKPSAKRVAAKYLLTQIENADKWPFLRKVTLFQEILNEPISLFNQKPVKVDILDGLFTKITV